jgi:autotransporter-associated beta strand protein/T5SS/PEP-CTERM-associated repeat protein
LTGNGTMDVGANVLTNSGVISGAGSLTKAGAGTMVLGAANTYTGETTINAGTVAISNGSSFGSNTVTFASNGTTVAALASVQVTNNYALTGNGTMDVGANVLTNSGVISGAGSLTKAGAGTMVLGAANTYAGGTTINAGTVAISNGSSFGSNTVTFASNGTTVAALASVQVTNNYALTGNGTMDVGANVLTNSGVISGAGGLTKAGAGTMVLGAANTYTGGTTINAGTVAISNGASFGSNTVTFASNGTTVAALASVEVTNNYALTGSGTMDVGANILTNSGVISGSGSLTKLGAGTMVLSGSNSYTGTTTISAGVLALSNTDALSGSTLDYSSAGTISFGSLTGVNLGGLQGSANLALANAPGGAAVALNVGANSSNTTYSGILSGAGSLTKAGAGTLILGQTNTYAGGTTINAGTVAISNGSSFGSSTVTFGSNGTTVAALASMQVTNNYALTGNGTMDVGANVLTNSGVISGAGSLTKAGAGTLVLGVPVNFSRTNTYTGGTTINAGTVAISNRSSFGSSTVTFASNGTTVAALASMQVTNNFALTGNGTMDVGANILTARGLISGAGSLTKAGAGTLILNVPNAATYTGGTTVNGGTLSLNAGATLPDAGPVTVTGAGSVLVQVFNDFNVGASASGRQLVVSNGGTVGTLIGVIGRNSTASNNEATVTGSNSLWTNSTSIYVGYDGSGNSLVISNGGTAIGYTVFIGTFASSSNNSVLVTGANSRLNTSSTLYFGYGGSGGNSLVISNGGTVAASSSDIGVSSINNSALVTGAGSLWTNSGTLRLGPNNTNNALTVSDGGTLAASAISIAANAIGSSGTLNIGRFGTNDTAGTITAPTIAFGAGTGVINLNQSDATTITAAISGNGAVKQLGTGTTTLSASNTYTGDTTISAGTLRFSTENSAGRSRIIQTTLNSLVEFLGSGRMTNQMTAFQYGFAESFEAAGQVTLADTASSISVASGKTVTGSGQFTGTGGLTKNGLGTLSLTAANNFSGPVAVQSGLLNLNASSGAAAASISSVSVASGATLLLSRSDQVNNGATVSLSGGTIRRGGNVGEVFGNLTISTASFLDYGAANDAGTIRFGTYAPSALLTVQNFLPGNKLQFGNTISSTDLNNTSLFQFSNGFTTGTESGFFTITAIPEPSTYLAALGLLALMLWPLRRRLRGKA